MRGYDGSESGASQRDICELTGGSEKRARALLTGIVSGRCAHDVTCESRVKVCPSTHPCSERSE
jgi:hypothetical protein